jgi:hypothetical protein
MMDHCQGNRHPGLGAILKARSLRACPSLGGAGVGGIEPERKHRFSTAIEAGERPLQRAEVEVEPDNRLRAIVERGLAEITAVAPDIKQKMGLYGSYRFRDEAMLCGAPRLIITVVVRIIIPHRLLAGEG